MYLCKLGIHMQKMAVKYRREHPEDKSLVPPKPPNLKLVATHSILDSSVYFSLIAAVQGQIVMVVYYLLHFSTQYCSYHTVAAVKLCRHGIAIPENSMQRSFIFTCHKVFFVRYANATRKSPPFYCRDNISNFLDWSIEFGVKHSCRFETDDLTLRKNDRQVVHNDELNRYRDNLKFFSSLF